MTVFASLKTPPWGKVGSKCCIPTFARESVLSECGRRSRAEPWTQRMRRLMLVMLTEQVVLSPSCYRRLQDPTAVAAFVETVTVRPERRRMMVWWRRVR
jgi:hypothetical protein